MMKTKSLFGKASPTDELSQLAFRKYGTDKCPQIGHFYTPYYYNLLKDKKDTVKKVVEVGVGSKLPVEVCPDQSLWASYKDRGASLYMWRDFFPNATIFGADNQPSLIFKDDRIETFLCNQSSKDDLLDLLKKTGTDIDLFIDDGSHRSRDQIFTFTTVMPLLKNSAIYVIEDVHYAIPPYSDLSYLAGFDYEIVHLSRRRDDRLIIVRHKS